MDARTLRDRLPGWIDEMRRVAATRPATGACAVATAMEVWKWTHDRMGRAAKGGDLRFETCAAPLAEAIGWLMAARALVLQSAPEEGVPVDVCHAHVSRACGEVARVCSELVFGSLRHPAWESDAAICYQAADLEALEEYIPGLTSCARAYSDVIEADGSHPNKAGPCVRFDGLEEFIQLRSRLDGCLAGGYAARQRAAAAFGEN